MSARNHKPTELKVILLGDPASGKTTLANSWETRTTKVDFGINNAYAPTCGVEFYTRRVSLGDSRHATTLTIWDVSGSTLSRPKSLSTYIYKANVILFLYALNKTDGSQETGLMGARRWIEAVTACWDRDPGGKGNDVYLGLVGTKSDLTTGEPEIPGPGHAEFCDRWRVRRVPFVVCGKTGEGVNSMYTQIASDWSGIVYSEDKNGVRGVVPATVHRSARRQNSTAFDGESARQKEPIQDSPESVNGNVTPKPGREDGGVSDPVRTQNDGSQTCSIQ